MSAEDKDWYLNHVDDEIEELMKLGYYGHVDFQFNMRNGAIANMTISTIRSIKKITGDNNA